MISLKQYITEEGFTLNGKQATAMLGDGSVIKLKNGNYQWIEKADPKIYAKEIAAAKKLGAEADAAYMEKLKKSKEEKQKAKQKTKQSTEKSSSPKIKSNLYAQHKDHAARDAAHKMGLEYYGFGYWGRNDKVLYKTEFNKLVPVDSKHYLVTTHARKEHPKHTSWDTDQISKLVDYKKILSDAGIVVKKLTPDEKQSVEDYVEDSSSINLYLNLDANKRKNMDKKPSWHNENWDGRWISPAEQITHLDSAIAKYTTSGSLTVYRGLGPQLAKKIEEELKTKNLIRINNYLSTSVSPRIANTFGSSMMIILIPSGSNVLPVTNKGTSVGGLGNNEKYEGEKEIILPRDSTLRLVRIENRKTGWKGKRIRYIFELV